MDSKTAEFLTKLVLEDNEDDVVSFAFPNDKRKIRCSISVLAGISPVFATMFSSRWSHDGAQKYSDDKIHSDEKPHSEEKLDSGEKLDSKEIVDSEAQLNSKLELMELQDEPKKSHGKLDSNGKTIQLNDEVHFDQYITFKLLMQILYGLRRIDSLSVEEATGVYYYTHKYQIKDLEIRVQNVLNQRMEYGISKLPLSLTELTEALEFAQLYNLDGFKDRLNRVKLALDQDNPIQFLELTESFKMKALKKQVLEYLKTAAPKNDWTMDVLVAVVKSLQADRRELKKALGVIATCGCSNTGSIYCYCKKYRMEESAYSSKL